MPTAPRHWRRRIDRPRPSTRTLPVSRTGRAPSGSSVLARGALGWPNWWPLWAGGGPAPVHCSLIWFWCRDARDHLGEASGVEVIVVRNPRAGLTSFGDHPE